MAELYPYPRFSIAERDRRWRAVRELMRAQNIDVIVTPQNSGHSADYQANTRYLTHCGGGEPDIAAVFPLDGEVTAIATSAAPRWPTVQDWTKDVREARRNYGRVIVERLKELGVEHGHHVAPVGYQSGDPRPRQPAAAEQRPRRQPVPVRVGAEYCGRAEILAGLTVGQNVVASGQFLIDSEANLRGAFDHLTGPDGH